MFHQAIEPRTINVTEIREPNFSVDLPGDWERAESPEAGAIAFREVDGPGSLIVLLLAVRPVYAIADRYRLLADYLKHRSTYEQGADPAFAVSIPVASESGDIEGGWDGIDADGGRRLRHRTLFVGNLLADFRFETSGLDEAAFHAVADSVLGSATVSAE